MATSLVIDKKLTPNTEYKFRINLTLGDVNVQSRILTFKTPPAIKLFTKLGPLFTYKITNAAGSVVPNTEQFQVDRFVKYKENGSYLIKLRMVGTADDYKKFNIQDKPTITFKTNPSNWLSGLHNGRGIFVEKTTQSRVLLVFSISKTLWDTINKPENQGQDLSVPANNKIELSTTTRISQTVYDVSVATELRDDLLVVNNQVQDVLVFAYRQYDGDLNSKVQRYYLEVNANIKDLTTNSPIPYSKAIQLFYQNGKQKINFTKRFDPKDGKKFIVYATVIRYKKVGGNWVGEWLQVNAADEPIWARAVVPA